MTSLFFFFLPSSLLYHKSQFEKLVSLKDSDNDKRKKAYDLIIKMKDI